MLSDFWGILEMFKDRRVIVVGDILLDKYLLGEVKRLNPEQPAAPVVNIYGERYVLGGAANVANNIASLGAKCCLYGVIGKDSHGKKVEKICNEKGIDLRNFYADNPTIVKQRVLAHGQQMIRLDFGEHSLEKISNNLQDKIMSSIKYEIKDYDCVILSDYNKLMFGSGLEKKIIETAKKEKIKVLVDPKPRNGENSLFKGCTIIRPNKIEAEKMTGIEYSKEKLKDIGKCLSEKLDAEYSVITCGEEGAFVYDRKEGNSKHIKTIPRNVADVTGAGDTFIAVLALGLSTGLDVYRSAEIANYIAGMVVEYAGTKALTIKEIKEHVKRDF